MQAQSLPLARIHTLIQGVDLRSADTSPSNYSELTPFIDLAQTMTWAGANMTWELSLIDAGWDTMTGGDIPRRVHAIEERGPVSSNRYVTILRRAPIQRRSEKDACTDVPRLFDRHPGLDARCL
jgi:hypothetical protein